MGLDPTTALLVGGAVVLLGFVVNYLFQRTGISDAIFLLLFGLVLGSYLHVIDPGLLLQVAPFFSPIALLIILMDGGLTTDLYQALRGSFRATLLAGVGFLLTVALTAAAAVLLLGWRPLHGLLLGAVLGNATPLLIFPLVDRFRPRSPVGAVLRLESTLAEILAIVVSLALLESLTSGSASGVAIVRDVAANFSVGAMVGLIAGVLWFLALERVSKLPYAYMVTLAIAFLIFSGSEFLGGSGPLSALMFGLVLGNEEHVAHILKLKRKEAQFDKTMRAFHEEITFFIRSFFFVYLGALVSVRNVEPVLLGLLTAGLLVAARVLAVRLCTIGSPLKAERRFMAAMMPRGLAAAVLAVAVVSFSAQNPSLLPPDLADLFLSIAFVAIVATILLCTGLAYRLRRTPGVAAPVEPVKPINGGAS